MVPAVPIVGGVAVVGLAALALRARAKAKLLADASKPAAIAAPKSPAPIPAPGGGAIVPPTPTQIALALPPLTTNPDGSDHTQGTPFVFDSHDDAADAVAEANRRGISVHQVLLERSGQLPAAGDGVVTASGQQAVVTTKDPAPAGDLIIRSAPSGTAPQIGGAEKNGVVTLLDSSDAVFAKIQWSGGARLPAATGFARKAFLKLV